MRWHRSRTPKESLFGGEEATEENSKEFRDTRNPLVSSSRMSFRIPTFPSVVALRRRILSLSLLILHPKILSRGVTRHSRRRFIYARYIGSGEIKFNANVNRFNGCASSRIESKYLWRYKYFLLYYFSLFFLNYEISKNNRIFEDFSFFKVTLELLLYMFNKNCKKRTKDWELNLI